jgi:hypothetical protein
VTPDACFASQSFSEGWSSAVSLSAGMLRPDFEQPEQLVNKLTINRNIINKTGVILFLRSPDII